MLLNGLAKSEQLDCGLVKGEDLYCGLAKGKLLQSWMCFPIVKCVFCCSVVVHAELLYYGIML